MGGFARGYARHLFGVRPKVGFARFRRAFLTLRTGFPGAVAALFLILYLFS